MSGDHLDRVGFSSMFCLNEISALSEVEVGSIGPVPCLRPWFPPREELPCSIFISEVQVGCDWWWWWGGVEAWHVLQSSSSNRLNGERGLRPAFACTNLLDSGALPRWFRRPQRDYT